MKIPRSIERKEAELNSEYFFYKKNKKTEIVKYRTYTVGGRKVIYYKNISEAERLSKKLTLVARATQWINTASS